MSCIHNTHTYTIKRGKRRVCCFPSEAGSPSAQLWHLPSFQEGLCSALEGAAEQAGSWGRGNPFLQRQRRKSTEAMLWVRGVSGRRK